MPFYRGSGSQCDRLGLPRSRRPDRCRGHSSSRNHSRTDVVTGRTPSSGRAAGKRILITGAARGMGRSHALRLAEEGADLILVDMCESLPQIEYPLAPPDDLAERVRLVTDLGGRCVSCIVDVRDDVGLRKAVDEGVGELGGLDG